MTSARAALAIVAAAAIAAVFALRGCGDDAARVPAAPTRATPEEPSILRSPSRRAASAASASEPEPSTDAANPPETGAASAPVVVEVTVLRSDGAPAEGAVVRIFESPPVEREPTFGEPRETPSLRGRAVTGRDGRARVEVADALSGGFVSAQLGEDAAISQERVFLKGGSHHAAELRLERSHRVRGVVVDSDGRRVDATSVRMVIESPPTLLGTSHEAYEFAVEPDSFAAGAFEFSPLGTLTDPIREPEQGFSLRVRADGCFPFESRYPPEAGRAGPIEVRLVRPGTVRGRCVDGDGHGLGDVRVEPNRRTASLGTPVVSGPDGRFEFAGLAQTGGGLVLSATGRAAIDVVVPAFDPASGADVGDVVLIPGETLRGRVVGGDGTPAAGARVWGMPARAQRQGAESKTDEEGRFTLDHLPPPPWRLYVESGTWGPGGQPSARVARVHLDVRPTDDLVIEVYEDRLLRIDVAFAPGETRGADPRLIQATLRRKGGESIAREPDPATRSAASFRWRFPGDGDYEAVIAADGFATVTLPMQSYAGGQTSFRVVLTRSAK